MKKLITTIVSVAACALIGVTASASCHGKGYGNSGSTAGLNRNCVGICVDADKDGLCDKCGSAFADANGDGICDSCCPTATTRGRNCVDANGDGKCDNCQANYADANGDGICDNCRNNCGGGANCGKNNAKNMNNRYYAAGEKQSCGRGCGRR